MGGLFDLPDVSDEDWLHYNADVFRRQTQPLADSMSFMQQTAMPVRSAIEQLANLGTAPPVATPPTPDIQAPTPMRDVFGGQYGGASQGLFGPDPQSNQVDPTSLLSTLSQYPDEHDGSYAQPTPGTSGGVMGPPGPQESSPGVPKGGGDQPGFWSGIAPGKPNIFSAAGSALGDLADQAKNNPFLMSGQGQFAAGVTRGLSNVAKNLGGTSEALRQGDVLGAAGGALNVATSPGDIFRGAAKEMNVPNQIFPQIDPETPFLGGVNNPQELAGSIPELLLPNTAFENVVGRAVGKVASPIITAAKASAAPVAGRVAEALNPRRVGEVLSPYVDEALSAGRRWADQPILGAAGRYFHGTFDDFDRAAVPEGGGRSYALPGYYATPDPEVAGRYAGFGIDNVTGERIAEEGGRVRAFDLDPDAKLLETRRLIPADEIRQIVDAIRGVDPSSVADPEGLIRKVMSDQTGPFAGPNTQGIKALFTLRQAAGDKNLVNALESLGYNGVRADEAGEIISLFDSGISKAKNVLSGRYGGIAQQALESPFFSPAKTRGEMATDIGMGAVGGVAGAATAPEDATWEERAKRGLVGAAAGAMGGPIARSEKGIGGLLREFRDETGELDLGAISRGRLNPPSDIEEDAWRGMTRNERRRANYKRTRGEYARRVESGLPDYGEATMSKVTPDEVPDAAQDAVYDRTAERLSTRGLPEDEADEAAYVVGRQAREEADDEIADRAPTLWDDYPELRPAEGPSAYVQQETASEEVARLTQNVNYVMPYSKPAVEKQERFIGAQTGLPGISGTEYRASTGRVAEELYDPETGRFQGFGETVGASDPQAVMQAVLRDVAQRTGSTPVGSIAAQTLKDYTGENLSVMLDPLEATLLPEMRSGTRRAIGRGASDLKNELPEVQDYADRMIALSQEELLKAHAGRSDQELQWAVDGLSKYALDIARSLETRSGLTSDALVAVMNRAVAATSTPTYLAYDRMRVALKNGLSPDSYEFQRLENDYKRLATVNAIYRAGLENVASNAGRALRANREDVYNAGLDERLRSFIPRVSGATVDSGDAARSVMMGNAPSAANAREQGQKAWNARIRAQAKGQPVEPVGPSSGKTWDDEYWQEVRKREIASKPAGTQALTGSGRRVGGPLEREGLLWSDLFIRDDPSFPKGTKLTEEERMRWLFGLEEVGIGKEQAQLDRFYDRMIDLNPDDRDAVLKFWADAAREGGFTSTNVAAMVTTKSGRVKPGVVQVVQTESPWEKGVDEAGKLTTTRGPDWNQYKKTAETMTRTEALNLTERTLKSRLEKAQIALERATAQKDQGLIKRYSQAVSAAQNELSGEQGLMARMERLYPPEIIGQSDRIQAQIRKLSDQHARATDPAERQGLLDQIRTLDEERNTAWQRQQYKPGMSQGFYDDPEILIRKAELLKELDTVDRGTQAFRGGLSVVTSNMLTSARMVEMSTMESALMMANRLYTQAVWRSDPEGAKQLAQGMWAGATPAWANFVRVMKTGSGPMESMNFLKDLKTKGAPAARSDSLKGSVGWLAPMHRVSRGIQEFFTTVAYYGELNRLAHVEAQKAIDANAVSRSVGAGSRARIFAGGPTEIRGKQPEFFPEMYMANPTEEMRNEALETALTIASGGPHSWVSKQIAALKSSLEHSDSPGGKAFGAVMNVLYPFVYGIDFTIRTSLKVGAGPVMYPVKAAKALAEGDRGAARAYGTAAAITTSIDMFLFHQITQGNITGKGPSNPQERQALLESTDENGDPTWRPDSMRVPLPNGRHIWMNYGSMPGIGVLAGVMSNMYDSYVWDGKQNETSAEVFGRLAVSTMQGVAEGTFFRDTLDVASILTEPQSASTAASRFAGGLVGRLVPAAVRQTAQASDPYRKTPGGFGEEIMQNIPGLRGMVPNQVSPFTGEDVRMGYNPASLLAPGTVYTGDGQTNPLATEVSGLQRQGLNVGPTAYSATQQGRGATLMGQRQTGEAVRGAQEDLATEGNAAAMRLINSPAYQQMSPEQKAANLEAVFSSSSERAKYDVQGNLQLAPAQQLTRAEMAIPRYEGVSGTPEQIARRNYEISSAKSALAKYQQVYGEDMGEMMLYRQDRNAWRDAVLYDEMDPDIRWLRSRQAAQLLGLNPNALAQPGVPGQLPGAFQGSQFFARPDSAASVPTLFPQPEQSYANRLPPGMR